MKAVKYFLALGLALCSARGSVADVYSIDDAVAAWKGNSSGASVKGIEEGLRKELGKKKLNEDSVIRLAELRVFASRFGGLKLPAEDEKTLEWLVRHPKMAPLLL